MTGQPQEEPKFAPGRTARYVGKRFGREFPVLIMLAMGDKRTVCELLLGKDGKPIASPNKPVTVETGELMVWP